MRLILILDGTVGAGKTSIARCLAKGHSARITSLSAFGFPTFHVTLFLAALRVGPKTISIASRYGYHPLSLLDKQLLRKLQVLIIIGELICRLLYFLKLLVLLLLSRVVIIDEGLVNTVAFYYWFYSNITASARILIDFYLRFTEMLIRHYRTVLIFVDAPQRLLIKRWFGRKRPIPLPALGCDTCFLITWCNIIRATYNALNRIYYFIFVNGGQ